MSTVVSPGVQEGLNVQNDLTGQFRPPSHKYVFSQLAPRPCLRQGPDAKSYRSIATLQDGKKNFPP
jgi:hypothetical protein